MDEPLVDQGGFPRGDIDVHSVRIARHDVIRMQNDHAEVVTRLERALHTMHAATAAAASAVGVGVGGGAGGGGTTGVAADGSGGVGAGSVAAVTEPKAERVPFATVNDVAPKSPAEEAGMMKGDELLMFGSVSADNFAGMAGIAQVVQSSVGKTIRVLVRRGTKLKLFPLVPHKWSGGGLLGCQIVPI
jgi:26S proteasome non-ATPase regulatory subunit 9